jgi:hypothetical protein
MADETPIETPAPEPEVVEPETPPSVEELQAQLAEEREARKLYEDTLKSLSGASPSATASHAAPPQTAASSYAPPPPQGGLSREALDRIRHATGLASDDDVLAWVKVAGPIFEEMARPAVSAIVNLMDQQDKLSAKLSIDGYKELEESIESEILSQRQRGIMLPRAEVAQLVRAKKLPELLAKEQERKAVERKSRSQAARAGAMESGSLEKAGPSPTKTSTRRDLDAIKALPTREDRMKALEELAGNTSF